MCDETDKNYELANENYVWGRTAFAAGRYETALSYFERAHRHLEKSGITSERCNEAILEMIVETKNLLKTG